MEEKKIYSVIGKVEIGTDEYRDLIEARMNSEKDKDYYMREGWKKDEKIRELEKQVEVLNNKLSKFENFIKKNSDISDAGCSVFMSIFGED